MKIAPFPFVNKGELSDSFLTEMGISQNATHIDGLFEYFEHNVGTVSLFTREPVFGTNSLFSYVTRRNGTSSILRYVPVVADGFATFEVNRSVTSPTLPGEEVKVGFETPSGDAICSQSGIVPVSLLTSLRRCLANAPFDSLRPSERYVAEQLSRATAGPFDVPSLYLDVALKSSR